MKKNEQILIVDNNMYIKFYPQQFLFKKILNNRKSWQKIIIKKPNRLTKSDLKADKIILTGSTSNVREEHAWMKKEQKYISEWMKLKKPILGICFGAQIIARTIFGPFAVESLPIPISGSNKIDIVKEGIQLFEGLPKSFGIMATHYEGFIVPEETIIGSTKEWKQYAFKLENNVYGLQFHPELMNTFGKNVLKLQKLFYDRHIYQEFSIKINPQHGKKIMSNFLKI